VFEGRDRVRVALSQDGRNRIVDAMTFSPFDKRLLEEGLAYFSRPRLASLLELLGTSERERVDALITMLKTAPPDEFDEAVDIFERATAKASRQRAWEDDRADEEEPRRKRYSAAAERREQRRRTG
jgi:hypothetical protein